MKKLLLLLAPTITLSVQIIIAQPTYSYTDGMLLIGDSVKYHLTNWTPAGASGAGQTWDFSTLPDLGLTIDSIVSPSTTPFGINYPNALVAEGNIFGYGYIIQDTVSLHSIGSADANIFVYYSDPWQMKSYPMSYGTNWVDSFSGAGNASGNNFTSSGVCTDTADAWGTLILPNGTFPNTLRLYSSAIYTETYASGDIHKHDWKTYEWYLSGKNRPLLIFHQNTDTINGTQVNQVIYAAWLDSIFTTASVYNINSSPPLVTLIPNPATSTVNITVKSDALNTRAITIYLRDIIGRVIATEQLDLVFGNVASTFNILRLERGIYIFEVIEGANHSAIKFIKN